MVTSDAALASLEANVWSMFSILGAGTGGSILDTPERLVVEAPLPQPPYNAVLRFRDDGTGPLAEQVAREWARFTRRGVNGVFLRHPTAPAAVDAAPMANGLEGAEQLAGMALDLTTDLPTRRAVDGVERAVWCGLSIGGMTALRAALGHRDRVRALMLADTDGGAEDAVGRARNLAFAVTQRAVRQRPLLATLDRLFLSATTRRDRPELVEELHARWVSNHRPSMSNAIRALNTRDDVLPMLAEVDLPCLEHPLEFNTALLEFLDDLG